MNRDKIVEYLDKQFCKHKVYECIPENETGYEYIPREALYKIVDGLIPMLKSEVKNLDIQHVSQQRKLLLDFFDWVNKENYSFDIAETGSEFIERYLKANNCC